MWCHPFWLQRHEIIQSVIFRDIFSQKDMNKLRLVQVNLSHCFYGNCCHRSGGSLLEATPLSMKAGYTKCVMGARWDHMLLSRHLIGQLITCNKEKVIKRKKKWMGFWSLGAACTSCLDIFTFCFPFFEARCETWPQNTNRSADVDSRLKFRMRKELVEEKLPLLLHKTHAK